MPCPLHRADCHDPLCETHAEAFDDFGSPDTLAEPNPHPYYAPGDPRRAIPYSERGK